MSAVQDAPGDAPCILIVEDEHSLATVMAGYFTRNGYRAEVVGDGLEAVAAARRPTLGGDPRPGPAEPGRCGGGASHPHLL